MAKEYEKDATHLAKRRSTREGRFGKKYEKDGEKDATHLAQAVTISNQR